jgi:hypothetical protein
VAQPVLRRSPHLVAKPLHSIHCLLERGCAACLATRGGCRGGRQGSKGRACRKQLGLFKDMQQAQCDPDIHALCIPASAAQDKSSSPHRPAGALCLCQMSRALRRLALCLAAPLPPAPVGVAREIATAQAMQLSTAKWAENAPAQLPGLVSRVSSTAQRQRNTSEMGKGAAPGSCAPSLLCHAC